MYHWRWNTRLRQFPGGSSATDGIVIDSTILDLAASYPYNLGRTASHEVLDEPTSHLGRRYV
jgi:hypothetical protein